MLAEFDASKFLQLFQSNLKYRRIILNLIEQRYNDFNAKFPTEIPFLEKLLKLAEQTESSRKGNNVSGYFAAQLIAVLQESLNKQNGLHY